MNKLRIRIAATALLLALSTVSFAQQPKQIKVAEFSVSNITSIEERVFVVRTILNQGYYCYPNPNIDNTIDVYVANDASDELSDFDFFYDNVVYDQLNEYSLLSKEERGELFVEWRWGMDDEVFKTLYHDFTRNMASDNATCETAFPFCTDVGLYEFPAGTDSGSPCGSTTNASCSEPYKCSGTPGQSTNCLSTAPNPAFYYLRIDEPGNLNIFMHSTPQVDIDFDCWGPFDDINTACDQLACSNIVDCSYSTAANENCHINNAQHEQYYILLITNYSNNPCNISFENVGTGTTDCSILPPLVNGGGPYCVGQTINLTAQNQAGASFRWSGPNGFFSDEQNPSIPNCTMEMAGIYRCTISVGGETSSAETEYIEVSPMPTADFTYVPACEGSPIQFTSTSTTNPAGQEIGGYRWDFGDGQTGNEANPSHTYAAAGDYEVTLNVGTGNGVCSDQITQTVTVYAIPVATATANPSSVMYGGTSTLTVNVETPGTFTYHWEPANMVTNPNSQTTQTVSLDETQVYTVTITNTEGGCSSTAQVTVAMAGSNLTATATADDYEICENSTTTLHANPVAGTGDYTYNWSPANLLSSTTTPNPVASPPLGSTTFNCTVSDGMTTQEVSVTIVVRPHDEQDLYEAICDNDTYNFYGQSLNTTGVYDHTLHNMYGCDSILHLHLTVSPNVSSDFSVERCDEYYWDAEGHEIVSTDHEDPIVTESGIYHRTYLNQQGCDSIVTLNATFEYTPFPTPIYPVDPDNTAPHWVVTATEFQINSYEFYLWDTNPHCHWDSVTWNFEDPTIEWVLEPDTVLLPKGQRCKMYVLNQVEDTVWLRATAYNRCSPQGICQRYWFVCSFYDVDDNSNLAAAFNVVPNPNNGNMTILLERLTGKVDMKVYDMRGSLIDHFETYNDTGYSSMEYHMNNPSEGIYFFVATSKEGTVAKKIIIE